MKYLLDTCICVDMIRKRVPVPIHLLSRPDTAISSITLVELEYGVCRSGNPSKNGIALLQFCAGVQIVPFDSAAASAYGHVRTKLEQAGTPIGPLDTLIAAHALSLNAVLVTNNDQEFRRVAGLTVETWTNNRT